MRVNPSSLYIYERYVRGGLCVCVCVCVRVRVRATLVLAVEFTTISFFFNIIHDNLLFFPFLYNNYISHQVAKVYSPVVSFYLHLYGQTKRKQ